MTVALSILYHWTKTSKLKSSDLFNTSENTILMPPNKLKNGKWGNYVYFSHINAA